MSDMIRAIRGMNDLLPDQTPLWQKLEQVLRATAAAHGYAEIRLPMVEETRLYARAIGEVTDIVEKEMYTFADRSGDLLALRPEGTAGCVRAAIEHNLLRHQQPRLFYQGPMFRYERPQKGRYRQFHQFGLESFGISGPYVDAELILLSARVWEQLGLSSQVQLELNSLGQAESRSAYRNALVAYLEQYESDLDEDSQRRLRENPLRILDSKVESTQAILQQAPVLLDFLDHASRLELDEIQQVLDDSGVPYRLNHRLVRGLDYYNHTVFEWVTNSLGTQGTVCAGGRYDRLVEQLGGDSTPAVGMAFGMERLVLMLQQKQTETDTQEVDMIVLGQGENFARQALRLAHRLRSNVPNVRILVHLQGGSFKSQFRRADRSGAELALLLGEEELRNRSVTLKWLRTGAEQVAEQQTIQQDDVLDWLHQHWIKK